jgi:endoribonuclease Dicer
MVSNAALAAACGTSNLYQLLIWDRRSQIAVNEYIQRLENSKSKEYAAAAIEGRQPGQYWAGVEFPKVVADIFAKCYAKKTGSQILSDALEALIAVIFISDQFTTTGGVEAVFNTYLKPFFERHITLRALTHHPTKNLCETLQGMGCHRFRMVKERQGNITEYTGKPLLIAAAYRCVLTRHSTSSRVHIIRSRG